MPRDTDKQPMTPSECCKVYGHSREFWVKLIQAGELRATDERAPGSSIPRWKIDPADVEAWKASRRIMRRPETAPVVSRSGFFSRMRDEKARKRAKAQLARS